MEVIDIVRPLKSKVKIIDTGEAVKLSERTRENIEDFWKEFMMEHPRCFRGLIYSVDKMEEGDNLIFTCSHSDFAHACYGSMNDLGGEACRNIYGSCLVVTADNYVAVALNGIGSGNYTLIQAIGGGVDSDDLNEQGQYIDPEITALRELEEETGVKIRSSIIETRPGYLLTDGKKYGVISIAYSSLFKSEMEEAFTMYKQETGNDEIEELIFFHKDKMNEIDWYEDKQDLGVVEMIRHFLVN